VKNIELPRKVVMGENALDEIGNVIDELRLTQKNGNPVVVSDENTQKIAGKKVSEILSAENVLVLESTEEEVKKLIKKTETLNTSYLIAVGGGAVIDAAKVASHRMGVPFLSVPTAASHDGIVSPQASLKGEKPVSIKAQCPLGVVVDTKIIEGAPRRLLSSGCADAISNLTAVLDWRLARDEVGEYYGDYAAELSHMSAEIVMENAAEIVDNVSILVEALISSGVAIGIAGSSRPCSGAEHQFSHTLDLICESPALHGEQCGVGSIMVGALHGINWEQIRDALKACGAPTTAEEMGLSEERIIEALLKAHTTRDRYTILRGGLSEDAAWEVAGETGVI